MSVMIIRSGALTIDRERYEVTVAGASVKLTYQEFSALWFIAGREGRVATYEDLARELWGGVDARARRRLAVLISRLRAKLGVEGSVLLDTVTRVGYRLVEPRPIRQPSSRSLCSGGCDSYDSPTLPGPERPQDQCPPLRLKR